MFHLGSEIVFLLVLANYLLDFGLIYILWRKKVVTKDDIVLIMKLVIAVVPQIQNPVVKALVNDILHAFAERLGLHEKDERVLELLKQLEQIAKQEAVRSLE